MKISIILPVYNAEKTIKKCIDSIINQTFKDYKIIVINDGSTDNTLNILNSYNDERLIVINSKNKGTGNARNIALDKVDTEYITFIDADDYIDSRYLEILYNNIINYSADIACSNRIKNKNKIEVLDRKKSLKYLLCLKEKYGVSVVAKLFKFSIIKDLRFDTNNHFEDIDYTINSFLNSKKVVYNKRKLYYITNLPSSRSKYIGIDRLEACKNMENKIKNEANFLYNDFIVYSMLNAIAIYNSMILNNKIDNDLYINITTYIKNNIKYVIKSNYNIIKKIQIYIFNYNKKLYNIIIKRLR